MVSWGGLEGSTQNKVKRNNQERLKIEQQHFYKKKSLIKSMFNLAPFSSLSYFCWTIEYRRCEGEKAETKKRKFKQIEKEFRLSSFQIHCTPAMRWQATTKMNEKP